MSGALPHLELLFPNLALLGYARTSEEDPGYNCIAWAAGDTSRNWDCSRQGGYWPIGAEVGARIEHLIGVFQQQGYAVCDNGDLEPEHEKVAL